jgi:hypothetical protein
MELLLSIPFIFGLKTTGSPGTVSKGALEFQNWRVALTGPGTIGPLFWMDGSLTRDQVKEAFPKVLSRIMSRFSDVLKGNDDAELGALYGAEAKMTRPHLVEARGQGPEEIVKLMRAANCEFHAKSYSFLYTKTDHVVVTGKCLWGNEEHVFTMVFRVKLAEKRPLIVIINQMIFK